MKFLPKTVLDALTIAANFLIKLFFQHRLIVSFIKRDLSTRYLGSTLGVLWAVIHPLVLLISYTFIFAILFRPGLAGGRYSEHFVLYLFAGLLPWLYFQDTVQRSATTLIEHSNLIRRTVFPSEILPVVIAGSNMVTHLIGRRPAAGRTVFLPRSQLAPFVDPLFSGSTGGLDPGARLVDGCSDGFPEGHPASFSSWCSSSGSGSRPFSIGSNMLRNGFQGLPTF